jgi:hypothetical protein
MAKNIPNSPKIHIQSGHKINQRLSLQDPPKFTQIGIFGLKIYHLATLRFWTSGPDGLAVARVYFSKLALNVRLGLGRAQARARFWAFVLYNKSPGHHSPAKQGDQMLL